VACALTYLVPTLWAKSTGRGVQNEIQVWLRQTLIILTFSGASVLCPEMCCRDRYYMCPTAMHFHASNPDVAAQKWIYWGWRYLQY
jgi:hypothetical protein